MIWSGTLARYVIREVGLYASLDAGERAQLRDELRVFIAEKGWEGVRDFVDGRADRWTGDGPRA